MQTRNAILQVSDTSFQSRSMRISVLNSISNSSETWRSGAIRTLRHPRLQTRQYTLETTTNSHKNFPPVFRPLHLLHSDSSPIIPFDLLYKSANPVDARRNLVYILVPAVEFSWNPPRRPGGQMNSLWTRSLHLQYCVQRAHLMVTQRVPKFHLLQNIPQSYHTTVDHPAAVLSIVKVA